MYRHRWGDDAERELSKYLKYRKSARTFNGLISRFDEIFTLFNNLSSFRFFHYFIADGSMCFKCTLSEKS